jgi:hypothetical protein
VPLNAGDRLVGTLEAGQTIADSFVKNDVELLQLIAGQAAVALRNALLYEEKEKHVAELSGLASLSLAVGVSLDLRELFGRLVKSIVPLFEVDIRLYREQPGHSRIIAGNCVGEVKNDDQVSRIEKETGRISEHDRIEPERVWGVAASILPGI